MVYISDIWSISEAAEADFEAVDASFVAVDAVVDVEAAGGHSEDLRVLGTVAAQNIVAQGM